MTDAPKMRARLGPSFAWRAHRPRGEAVAVAGRSGMMVADASEEAALAGSRARIEAGG
ncbi:hypothetical protein CC85DRAFT_284472 [Cutaneotrichosporon oleaginosum]|uniref:Uncharacterized protein n=1 Tax=Cutaneotrichosporon oleaginosum TaxID=879819 RepID=A0A0J0XR29_9TREE|nr:uncharacterized protein CC85DRAFT_284472 [Cutaneotrichosporon oleaginosum]KLT43548.1 hypothetical protein CC85DRAFT_284472 [Cutaneotrichosporon oleaginosum]TXT05553.1 hypothetical protein COLE_06873 [Cutaneotrichosporon oleaginosum]